MSNFQKPPLNRDTPPKGWIGVHQIEKDKKEAPPTPVEIPRKQAALMSAGLAAFIKKIFSFLGPSAATTKSDIAGLDKNHIEKQLLLFKNRLIAVGQNDQSHNPDFIQDLSEVWHELIHICNNDYLAKKLPDTSLKLRLLVKQISLFPPAEDHSLGSYLSKHVGTTWLPFPLIHIIQELYTSYQRDPRLSELNIWLSIINEILSKLEDLG